MLGPYNTILAPYCYYYCNPLIVIVNVAHCYCCAPQKPTIVIIVPLHYYCYVGSDYIVTLQTPIYTKEVLSFESSKNCNLCDIFGGFPSEVNYYLVVELSFLMFMCYFYMDT